MKRYIFFVIIVFLPFFVWSQSYDIYSGDWNDPANWNPDPGLTVTVDGDLDGGDDFVTQQEVTITRTGDITIHGGWLFAPTSLDINGTLEVNGTFTTGAYAYIDVSPGDTLFVDGDLNLVGGAMEVQPNGVVIITGNCNLETAVVDIFGDFIVLGDLNMNDAGGSIRSDGNLVIAGDLDIQGNSPVIIFGDSDGSDNFFVIGDSSSISIENPGLTEICSWDDPCDVNYGDIDDFLLEDQDLLDLVNELINEHVCTTGISAVVTNPTCVGGSEGSINLTLTGYSASATITWSNASWTVDSLQEDINGLIADSYHVEVVEGLCSHSADYTVNDGLLTAPLAPVATAGTAAACGQITSNWNSSADATSYR
ncbi:MAG: hypothetical protein JXP36_09880, partial [Bacteroidales bacterium]|nr:hypothetical protein [Bacteroidales bacterium]MBN2819269.1 hypothetical protein [Bacteroidales bacterium]